MTNIVPWGSLIQVNKYVIIYSKTLSARVRILKPVPVSQSSVFSFAYQTEMCLSLGS